MPASNTGNKVSAATGAVPASIIGLALELAMAEAVIVWSFTIPAACM
jgi:hypothetical protein